jgi:hypothetical protein
MLIYTTANYHWVKTISASTHGDDVITLTLRGSEVSNCLNEAEIKIFTDDRALVARLVKAINSASEVVDA